jgi:glycosyltransferase involved in cell wall biosynthesis
MKISIITVTYNSQEFLEKCIDSIKTQSYPNIEHIIVDGNSTDDTLNIIKKNSHIKWISENDDGIYDAINKGIKIATGEVVGVLNSDDFLADENVIQRVVSAFNDHNVDSLYADVVFVDRYDTSKKVRFYSSKRFKKWMFKFGFQPAHPTFYAKRIVFEQYGSYRTDLKIAGDFELMLRFFVRHNVSHKYIDDVWVKMRIGGISTSGLASVRKLNREIVMAHHLNKLNTNILLVYAKYLVKWWGFVFRK